jgi:class 3 adenylate cyclase/pimeloyl-ACP methyl ester carboxylesterase
VKRRPRVSETSYAKVEGAYLAYQIVGEGPRDLVFTTSPIHNIDVMWEQPSIARFFGRLAGIGRLICYNPRGTGVSSPMSPGTSLQEWMDDLRGVMDAVGVERAAIIGDTEGGPTAMMFAATYPERTSALVLINTFARFMRDVDYPAGLPAESIPKLVESFEQVYGTGAMVDVLAPSAAVDEEFRTWHARYQRLSMSGPGAAGTGYRAWLVDLDVRPILPSIRVPTLVLHRADNGFVRSGHGRFLADAIPGAKYVDLPGRDALYFVGDSEGILDEIEEFLTGARAEPEADRVLATILFTDVVGSTKLAADLGDRKWKEVLDRHDEVVRRQLARFRGREVITTGDGFLATFDGPARAINCARGIGSEVSHLGIDVRSGLHTGEVQLRGDDVSGIAVHLAARVMGTAGPGETIVSSTVKDLVVGSGIEFDDRGSHVLKGVPGEWHLYAAKA